MHRAAKFLELEYIQKRNGTIDDPSGCHISSE